MKLLLCLSFFSCYLSFSQTAWAWTELDIMTAKVSNSAVSAAEISGEKYVFSFGGIDATKLYSGINKRAFKYRVSTDQWVEINELPSLRTNIAASANTVKNKIYIIGGYHVYANGSEVSSNEVIIYNPITDLYEPNGVSIPVPIDDQVQCVWRDSLIFVITGWSNNGNIPSVQIYNPELNQWSVGQQTPNNHDFKAFGASGEIIGDTIYYFGGAKSSGGFNAVSKLRKGIINQNDPTDITWVLEGDAPNNGYRSACVKHGDNVFWVGGAQVSYNYNGIAYNGSGGVLPLTQIMRYDAHQIKWYAGNGAPFSVMDLRGVAQITPTKWIVCGGMNENQAVTNKTFLLEYDPVVGGEIEKENKDDKVFVYNHQIICKESIKNVFIYDLSGRLICSDFGTQIDKSLKGFYILKLKTNQKEITLKISL